MSHTHTVVVRGSQAVTGLAGGATYAIPVTPEVAEDLEAGGFTVHEVTTPRDSLLAIATGEDAASP